MGWGPGAWNTGTATCLSDKIGTPEPTAAWSHSGESAGETIGQETAVQSGVFAIRALMLDLMLINCVTLTTLLNLS